jgi:DNA end-binding protein Ku
VKQVLYCQAEDKPIERSDIVKGYEYEKDQYVVLTDEDFRRANMQQAKSVDITTFVDADAIPPQYFETPYYLVPEPRGQKVYALLRETLRAANKIGVGEVVIRTTHHLAAVVPVGDALMMITMRYPDEIREGKAFDFPSRSLKNAGIKPKEVELARKLIEDMAGPFKPEEFEDTYNEDLMHRIQEKIKRGETQELTKPEGEKEAPRSAKVIDLMELLKQSIDSGGKRARKTANGAAKEKASVSEVSDARKARAKRTRKTAKPATETKSTAGRKRA